MCIINTNTTAAAVPALVYKYGLILHAATLEKAPSSTNRSSRQLPSELPLTVVSLNLRLTG
jgi:hypothetical protein